MVTVCDGLKSISAGLLRVIKFVLRLDVSVRYSRSPRKHNQYISIRWLVTGRFVAFVAYEDVLGRPEHIFLVLSNMR